MDSTTEIMTSWLAAFLPFSISLCPMYCDTTMVPPVARALNTYKNTPLIMSTRETPEIAASPACDTIIVSATPTSMTRTCSMISGTISAFRS